MRVLCDFFSPPEYFNIFISNLNLESHFVIVFFSYKIILAISMPEIFDKVVIFVRECMLKFTQKMLNI